MTRLTKGLQAKLVNDLVEDQFKDEFEALKKRYETAVIDAVPTKLIEDSDAIIALQKSLNNPGLLEGDLSSHIWITHPSMPTLYTEGKDPAYVFELRKTVENHNRSYAVGKYASAVHLGEASKEVQDTLQDYKAFITRIKQMQKEAREVLANIPTVKKLKEVTKVFDPFLPSDATAGTALIPVDSLVSLNTLKTPKAKKAA